MAEMTSALLCAVTGIDTADLFDNSAGYLANWASALRADPHLIVTAASQAFKAADFVLGEHAEQENTEHDHRIKSLAPIKTVGAITGWSDIEKCPCGDRRLAAHERQAARRSA